MHFNRLEKLLEFYKEDPDDPFTIYAIALEYMQENPSKAMQYFQLLLDNHIDYTGTYYQAGKVLVHLGRRDDALRIYDKGIHICQKKNDRHALAELQTAKNNLLYGDDEEED
jgi:tetratricopeptide (TPR) repeat protein